MNEKRIKSLTKCFNYALLGWRHKENRALYQRQLLEEYEAIGGKAFCVFSQVMEMKADPKEFLTAYYELLKEIQKIVDKNGKLTHEQWSAFIDKAQDDNTFYEKGEKTNPVLDIPVIILRMYHVQEEKIAV